MATITKSRKIRIAIVQLMKSLDRPANWMQDIVPHLTSEGFGTYTTSGKMSADEFNGLPAFALLSMGIIERVGPDTYKLVNPTQSAWAV